MTEEEFSLTRGFLRKYILHYAPTTSKRLGYAVDDKFYGLSKGHLEQYKAALDKMTLADVNKAIRKYLQSENLVISIITQNGDTVKKNLVQNLPSPITYTSAKDEHILAEDKIISAYPLAIKDENVEIIRLDELFK